MMEDFRYIWAPVLFLLNLVIGWALWAFKRATIPRAEFYALHTRVEHLERGKADNAQFHKLELGFTELRTRMETLEQGQERIEATVLRIDNFLREQSKP